MASDRGFTGNPPVDILTMSKVYPYTLKARPDDLTITKLIKDVNAGLDGNATILSSVFRNRCETIPLDKERIFL
jgi:hypothetical protein